MELRQLRYFVTLAEELHFGRAAAREHIVQSALSQQIQRLERGLGVLLLERTTRRIQLTEAGGRFLVEARHIIARVDRAAEVVQRAAGSEPALRVAVMDESYDSMRQILCEVQSRYPDVEIHQIHAGLPEQFRLLMDGRLDAGIGRAALAPPEVASELLRLDPLGILIPDGHRFAGQSGVPIATLAGEPLLLSDEQRAPEFNQFLMELCRAAGFVPTLHRGTVQCLRAAVDLVTQRRCLLPVPASSLPATPGVIWRPLERPATNYPWSLLWRAGDRSQHVKALLQSARALSRQRGWREPTRAPPGSDLSMLPIDFTRLDHCSTPPRQLC